MVKIYKFHWWNRRETERERRRIRPVCGELKMGNVTEIVDINAPELSVYARLTEAELMHLYEPKKEGLFIAESPNVAMRALDAGYEPVSLLLERKHIEGQAGELIRRAGDVPVYTATLYVLKELTGFELTRGILMAMKRRPLPAPGTLLSDARRVAVLERIMNPTNLGAVFRSAAAFNIDAVLLTEGSSDPLYRRAARVSMGTVFQIPWTFIRDADEVRQYGFQTAAMALRKAALDIGDPRLKTVEKLAIVLGTEGDGLLKETIHHADYTVMIPMSHGVDSLNVAAAGAVAFYELTKPAGKGSGDS